MRFELFHPGLLGRPDVIAVDMIHHSGLWGPCFSHHPPHNNLPRYAADTTTEGVLRFLYDARYGRNSPNLARFADATVTTHHFDADALLPVWALLHPEGALEQRDLLERVARSGDFFIYLDDAAAQINFAIEETHHRLRGTGIRGERLVDDRLTEACFAQLLPQLEALLGDPAAHTTLWERPYRAMQADLAYLSQPGRVTEVWRRHLSLVETDHDPDTHALNTVCRNDLLLVWRTDSGERRLEVRPAIAWYELTSLPHRPRYALNDLAQRLNAAEQAQPPDAPGWKYAAGPIQLHTPESRLSQTTVVKIVGEWLAAAEETQVPTAYRADVCEVFRTWDRHAIFTSHRRFAASESVSFTPGRPYNGLHYQGAPASFVPEAALPPPSPPRPLPGGEQGVPTAGADKPIRGQRASFPAGKAPIPFAVSDDFYWNRAQPTPLTLSLTYEDRSEGTFWAEVDSWTHVHLPTPRVALCGDGWTKTVTIPLPEARLGANQEGGADLRLMRSPGTALTLCEIALHKSTASALRSEEPV